MVPIFFSLDFYSQFHRFACISIGQYQFKMAKSVVNNEQDIVKNSEICCFREKDSNIGKKSPQN